MYANFTEETCTGTGDTLALAGATTGHITFVKSFADGDLVSYVVEDSGGVIKIAGVGTYVSATDDITRNDTWNYSSGGVVDESPSTNITLSGGTHTVRCDLAHHGIAAPSVNVKAFASTERNIRTLGVNGDEGASSFTVNTAEVSHTGFLVPAGVTIDAILFEVTTLQAASFARVGICSIDKDGEVSAVLAESSSIDTSTTGKKTATFTGVFFPVETVVYAWVSGDAAIVLRGFNRTGLSPTKHFNHSRATNYRSAPTFYIPTAVAPVYPTIGPLSFDVAGNLPDLLLRWT